MTDQVSIPGKPLLAKYQSIMAANPGAQDPTIMAALHAMFMAGAGAVAGILSKATEETVEQAVQEMVDELNDYTTKMQLTLAPSGTMQ